VHPSFGIRRTAVSLALLSVLCGALPAAAADEPAVAFGTRASLRSEVLGEERPLLIHLPKRYAAADTARYPVLYVLDGESHFTHVVTTVEFLAARGNIPELIVVAVPNTGDRNRDLTPPPSPTERVDNGDLLIKRMPTAGGADRFLRFLTSELIPHIDARYRTQPYRLLHGHSFGGLFAMHTLVHKPESFHAYLAIAPSLQWNSGELVRQAPDAFSRLAAPGRALYLTENTGDADWASSHYPVGNIRVFAKALGKRKLPALTWRYDEVRDEDHGSIPHPGTYAGLKFVFSGWKMDEKLQMSGDLARIEAHYVGLSKRLGYPVQPPEAVLNWAGYRNLEAKNLPQALATFERAVALYPTSANAYDSLADGLETAGRLQEAIERYERAVALAREQKDPTLPEYQKRLDAVRARLGTKPAP
jgi:hypothetical protein